MEGDIALLACTLSLSLPPSSGPRASSQPQALPSTPLSTLTLTIFLPQFHSPPYSFPDAHNLSSCLPKSSYSSSPLPHLCPLPGSLRL